MKANSIFNFLTFYFDINYMLKLIVFEYQKTILNFKKGDIKYT